MPQFILVITFFSSQLEHRKSLSQTNESFIFFEGLTHATVPNCISICSGRLGAREGIKRDPLEMASFITGSAAKVSEKKEY